MTEGPEEAGGAPLLRVGAAGMGCRMRGASLGASEGRGREVEVPLARHPPNNGAGGGGVRPGWAGVWEKEKGPMSHMQSL